MLTAKDRAARHKGIEDLRNLRIKNLRRLAEAYGSWAELARAVGCSGTFLTAVAGPNPRRNIGEKLARDLENTLNLKAGWFDTAH